MACEACHTVFPELTHFGRVFKANGYTLTNLKQVRDVTGKKEELLELAQMPPLSIMAQISYTQMKTSVPDLSAVGAPGVAQNGTAGFPQQFSLFYAGKIAPALRRLFPADLRERQRHDRHRQQRPALRRRDTAPPTTSTPHLRAVAQQQSHGAGSVELDPRVGLPLRVQQCERLAARGDRDQRRLRAERRGPHGLSSTGTSRCTRKLGGYRSAQQGVTNQLTGGAGPLDGTASNVISGLSPYWRLAYEYDWDRNTISVGTYGMDFRVYPGGAPGAAVPLRGPLNRFNDVAEDVQYQFIGEEHIFSVLGTHIHESMSLDASFASGAAANPSNTLTTTEIAATYYYRRRIGGTVQYFSTTGSADTALYPATAPGAPGVVTSANGSPDTRGWIAEVNYLPWLNVKVSVQYIWYSKFNGAGSNYDGVGRNASDNDTLYLLLWFAY